MSHAAACTCWLDSISTSVPSEPTAPIGSAVKVAAAAAPWIGLVLQATLTEVGEKDLKLEKVEEDEEGEDVEGLEDDKGEEEDYIEGEDVQGLEDDKEEEDYVEGEDVDGLEDYKGGE